MFETLTTCTGTTPAGVAELVAGAGADDAAAASGVMSELPEPSSVLLVSVELP